ncbi:MAG: HAMP domain-containing sensor histidine kinase, partial [Ktedonobacterales bacterium]
MTEPGEAHSLAYTTTQQQGDSAPIPQPIPQERDIYRAYDRTRRLRIARILGLIFCILQVVLLIVVGVIILHGPLRSSQRMSTIIGFSLTTLVLVFYLVGTFGAYRGHVRIAALGLLTGTGMIYTLPLLIYVFQNGVDAFVIAVLVGSATFILLVSVLTASQWPLILATLLANVETALIVLYMPTAPGLANNIFTQPLSLVATVILIQWGVAGVQLAAQQQSLRTLRELGDIRIAYERARQLDELKDQFISNVNHELRNPVMALQGYVQLLSISGETMTPQERALFLERATVAGDQLGELVTSILNARQLDRDATDFTPEVVEVRPTLEAAASLIDPREGNMVERDLRVHIPDGLTIWGEHVRLRQILTNLLSNAIKYSPPGAP